MGCDAFIRLWCLSDYYDWFIRFNRLESDCNLIKLYCLDVNIKYGNEHSFNCEIFTIKKRIPNLTKREAILDASKKMMLPILYTVLTTICAFFSLVFSEIKPIIDFGWMMTIGLLVSFLITFFFTFTIKYFFIRK